MSSLTRWNPLEEISAKWPREFFGRLRPSGELSVEWNPRCSMTETPTEIVVHAELPGVDTKDIDISVTDSTLTIKGEKRSEKTIEENGETYNERFFGGFERQMSIPEVDQDNISATMKDGVLEVKLPKSATPKAAPKKVEIKAG